ncbi:MAG: diguanylate cyclase [Candidatus Limnocylindria bacterium]
MRLLAVLALAAPAALGILIVAVPDLVLASLDAGGRTLVTAIATAAVGVSMTALLVAGWFRFRFAGLVRAAERIASGDYTSSVGQRHTGLERRLAVAMDEIATALADTTDRATFDRLTGVANRQSLLANLFAEVERASRYERPLSVAFVDIDHFKAVNDTYGHATGDVVLRGVAQTIAANLRASDLIGRYGGEEFMLILTETGIEDGAALTEKIRTLVERQRFTADGGVEISVTISIGIAGGAGKQLRMEALVRDADAAMYSAKSLGRNQTYIFAEPDDDARVPRAPISAAGRARAIEIGQQARDAATTALADVLAPLPNHRGQASPLIATIAVALAQQLQLPDVDVDRLRVAALLHDVGKIAIPEEILEKPTSLNPAEWRTVVQHPRIGQVILEQSAALKDAVPIILHHHERYAGHGYPYGLRANEIPLGARIVAIADAYEAMVNDRPYKAAMSHDMAIAELRRHAGTQFDPELVTLFCDLYASSPPVPDATARAIATARQAHHRPTLVTPPARPGRRRRRSPVASESEPHDAPTGVTSQPEAASATMAGEASIDVEPTISAADRIAALTAPLPTADRSRRGSAAG